MEEMEEGLENQEKVLSLIKVCKVKVLYKNKQNLDDPGPD